MQCVCFSDKEIVYIGLRSKIIFITVLLKRFRICNNFLKFSRIYAKWNRIEMPKNRLQFAQRHTSIFSMEKISISKILHSDNNFTTCNIFFLVFRTNKKIQCLVVITNGIVVGFSSSLLSRACNFNVISCENKKNFKRTLTSDFLF